MKKLFLLAVFFFLGAELFALPRFAARSGGQCIDCHINPTGGMLRTKSGWGYGKNNLALTRASQGNDEPEAKLSPKIGDNIYLGLDFRTQYIYSELAGKRTDFQNMQGTAYLGIDLGEKMKIFAKNDFVNRIWEAWGLANVLPMNGYLKAGVFSPSYGIRLDDHTAYTRGGDAGIISSTNGMNGSLGYDARYLETGVEFGFMPLDLVMVTASVGRPSTHLSPFANDPTYTFRTEIAPPFGFANVTIGGSYASMKTNPMGTTLNTTYAGGFITVGKGPFSLLAEYDAISNLNYKDTSSSAFMLEAAYKVTRGLEAVVRYDGFDFNTNKDKDNISHLTIGLEYYPVAFMEIRPQYRIYTEEPKVENNAFVLQFHFWY